MLSTGCCGACDRTGLRSAVSKDSQGAVYFNAVCSVSGFSGCQMGTFPTGAFRLIHNFTEEAPKIAEEDPGVVGIDSLVAWIEAGKP